MMGQTAVGREVSIIMPDEDSERKIEAMEKELQILKGSIKKLMIDIRDQMNKADNPFLNVQQLQVPAATVLSNNNIELEEEEEEELEEEEAPKKSMPEKPKPEKKAKEDQKPVAPVEEEKPEAPMLRDFEEPQIEEPQIMLEEMKQRAAASRRKHTIDADRMDPQTIIKLMQWTRTVLMKNGSARFNDLLDAYVTMGYVGEDVKAVIMKMGRLVAPDVEPIPKDMNIKECVGDMYALFMILHPREKELDSRMLSIMLGYEDSNMNML